MYTFRCFLDWQIIERGSGQCYFASVWADVCCSPGWSCISYFVDLVKRRLSFFFCFVLEAQKTRAVKSRLVIVFRLIGWETDASCLIGWETDASCLDQSAVKHHQRKPELLSTFYWKFSLTFYSMHVLHTALYTFPKMLTKRICLSIKNFFRLWSLPLFSWP